MNSLKTHHYNYHPIAIFCSGSEEKLEIIDNLRTKWIKEFDAFVGFIKTCFFISSKLWRQHVSKI